METGSAIRHRGTNPNPKVSKSGAVAKAVLASMVLEEGSIGAARGDSRDIRRIKETSAARDASFAVSSSFLPCTIKLSSCIFTFRRLIVLGGAHVRLCGGATFAPLAWHGAPALLSACGWARQLGRVTFLFYFFN